MRRKIKTISIMGDAVLKQSWTPTISKDEFENNYMTLEQSSARVDALIQHHFHPEVSCR